NLLLSRAEVTQASCLVANEQARHGMSSSEWRTVKPARPVRFATANPSRGGLEAEVTLAAALPLWVYSWLAFSKFQAGRLLPVAQPFVKDNALLIIENSFLKGCHLLGGSCAS